MSSTNSSSKDVSVDEQTDEHKGGRAVNEDGFEVVGETPEFKASVDQEVHTKVETEHPETVVGRNENEYGHLPLAQEEEIRARDAVLSTIVTD